MNLHPLVVAGWESLKQRAKLECRKRWLPSHNFHRASKLHLRRRRLQKTQRVPKARSSSQNLSTSLRHPKRIRSWATPIPWWKFSPFKKRCMIRLKAVEKKWERLLAKWYSNTRSINTKSMSWTQTAVQAHIRWITMEGYHPSRRLPIWLVNGRLTTVINTLKWVVDKVTMRIWVDQMSSLRL